MPTGAAGAVVVPEALGCTCVLMLASDACDAAVVDTS
jgi:hypothetical protein